MLDNSKIMMFEFGYELYVWKGKNENLERSRVEVGMEKEIWNEG
jgi:hypothetical protein